MARLINRLQLKPSKSSRQTVGQTLEPWFTVLNGFWTGFQVWPDIDRVSIRFYWVFTEFVDGKRGGAEDQRDEGDDFAPDDRRGHQQRRRASINYPNRISRQAGINFISEHCSGAEI